MTACPWGEINDFQTIGEFERFEIWIMKKIRDGVAVEIPVAHSYLNASSFKEKWFKHIESGTVWRLVWPDFPFTGLFEQVIDF